MKLPGRTEGAVQELVGVDPGVYAQRGQAVAGLGAAVGQVAGAIKQRRDDQDVHAGKLAGHEQRQQTAEIVSRLQNEDYISADDPALKGISDYTTRPDGSVLTSEVASQIYEARATELAEANAENMRPGKTRDLWEANQKTSIAERTAEIETRAGKIAKRERKIEDARMLGEAVDNQDWTGAMHAISMSGWSDQEKADRRAAVKVSRENSDVDNAILSRDLGEIDKQLELMGMAQDEYPGELNTNVRIRHRDSLERARSAIVKGNGAVDKAARGIAQQSIDRAIDGVMAGDAVNPGELTELLMEGYATGYGGDLSVTEAKKKEDTDFVINNLGLLQDMRRADSADRAAMLKEFEDSGTGADHKFRVQQLRDYNDTIADRIEDDPVQWAEDNDLIVRTQMDPNNIAESLGQNAAEARAASDIYQTAPAAISDRDATVFADRWANSTTDERVQMAGEVNTALGGDPALTWDFWNRVSENGDGHEWVAGKIAPEPGGEQVARNILSGQAINADPDRKKRIFDGRGYTQKQQAQHSAKLEATMGSKYPLTSSDMISATEDLTTHYIAGGMRPNAAHKQAISDVTGGLVKGRGTNETVRPPVRGMKQSEFRQAQTRVKNGNYNRNFNIALNGESLEDHVIQGRVVYRDTDGPAGQYNLYDTRTDSWILDRSGRPAVVDMNAL